MLSIAVFRSQVNGPAQYSHTYVKINCISLSPTLLKP